MLDQLSPSIKGGIPVLLTSCSKICLIGTELSRIWLSAPMTLMSTSPTATKSRTHPFLVRSMALLHSLASCLLRSWAMPRSHSPSPGL